MKKANSALVFCETDLDLMAARKGFGHSQGPHRELLSELKASGTALRPEVLRLSFRDSESEVQRGVRQ